MQPARPIRGKSPRNSREKVKGIQALVHPMQAILGFAGKMPGSGVTSRVGMGDNLSEIVV
jgi:hypothetical protein